MHAKLGERAFVSEFKYDGQRVQIHALYLPRETGLSNAEHASRKAELSQGKGKWAKFLHAKQQDEEESAEVEGGEIWVRLFSRHLEDMTAKYPDIIDLMPLLMGWQETQLADATELKAQSEAATGDVDGQGAIVVESSTANVSALEDSEQQHSAGTTVSPPEKTYSLIMDAEVVAIGLQGEPLPFQTLANRSRKDVNINDVKVKVGIFAFDLMYLDGKVG